MRNNKSFTIYISSKRGDKRNTSYPFEKVISSAEDLASAVEFDHVACKFRDGKNNRGTLIKAYRNNKCFESADCIIMDCDNTSADPTTDVAPEDWKTPADVKAVFEDVEHYIVYSRNHMKVKDGKAARSKFHVYFPLGEVLADADGLDDLKDKVQKMFPAFDANAVKISQFMFGVESPTVEFVEGSQTIDGFMDGADRANDEDVILPTSIPVGQRNSTLSNFAGKIITRYGDTDKAHDVFLEAAERCEEPLDNEELDTIWASAQEFFENTVEQTPGYTDPLDFSMTGKRKGFTLDDLKKVLKRMRIKVKDNEITGKPEIIGLSSQYSSGKAMSILPYLIHDYNVQHNLKASKQVVEGYLNVVMDENRFNPIRKILELTTWDGQDRISELIDIIGINETTDSFGVTLITKWLHQCIALALNSDKDPYGADGVLVLQGNQGIGKTLICSKLAIRPEWFAEGVCIDMSNKDTIIQSTGVWIAELGELDGTLKKEQNALKAFLTARQDVYRVPYGTAAITRPRRTSFCATVNPQEFLNDETGSRRFWVVKAHVDADRALDLDEKWLRQMWSQVYTEYYLVNPQGYRLDKSEQKKVELRNREFTKPMPGEIEILDRLDFDAPESKWTWKKTSEIINAIGCRGISTIQMGRVLTKLEKGDGLIKFKTVNGRKRYFVPPACAQTFYPHIDDDFPALMDTGEAGEAERDKRDNLKVTA